MFEPISNLNLRQMKSDVKNVKLVTALNSVPEESEERGWRRGRRRLGQFLGGDEGVVPVECHAVEGREVLQLEAVALGLAVVDSRRSGWGR